MIVGLRTDFEPEGRLSRPQADDQREAIASAGAGLRADLAGTGYQTVREYETVPYIALSLTPEAFRAVQDSPRATTIQDDVAVPADLAQSAPKVQAPTMWANNLTGGGKTIAVLDTGVDRFHPFLGGRVVEEACFSANSNCPNGQKTQTGTDSAAPCTYAPNGCRHGTHVSGIAAGQGSDFSGVAPNANIMAVQVFSRFTGTVCNSAFEDPCTRTFTSDQIAGMERVYQLRNTRSFAAVNMSLGGGRFFNSCDTDSRKAIIDNLKSAGIATVISSGNDGFTDSVGAPACISSAITVGNTTKQDTLASDSNSAPGMIDLLAPGDSINSSVPGGGFAFFSGTSMAAPHVSGAWALLEEQDPAKSWFDILFGLALRGTPVTDTRPGGTVTTPRINIAEASRVRPPNDDFVSPRSLGNSVSTFVNGISGAATRETNEPDHLPNSGSLGENSVWYTWTAPHSGPVTMDTCTSSFDTALVAYTGSAIGSLSPVAGDDDSCDAPNGSGSRLTFDAVAGTEYRIAVAGYAADTSGEGTFTLDVAHDPPPNDDSPNARTLSGNNPTANGTTVGATREFGEPDHYTTNPPDSDFLIGEHTVWYSWTAPFSGRVEMNTCASNIDSILAVYTGSITANNLSRVADNRNGCPGGAGSKVIFDATKGTTYRIAVGDAVGVTQGTFTLRVLDKRPPTVTSTGPADNATGISPGANVRATFSEAMQAGTINANTFKLRKAGSSTNVTTAVSYDPATNRATLNPNADLRAGATYVATVTTGATDQAGNQLDQNPSTAGNQSKSWKFKVTP